MTAAFARCKASCQRGMTLMQMLALIGAAGLAGAVLVAWLRQQ